MIWLWCVRVYFFFGGGRVYLYELILEWLSLIFGCWLWMRKKNWNLWVVVFCGRGEIWVGFGVGSSGGGGREGELVDVLVGENGCRL